jgi:hypothetical protein
MRELSLPAKVYLLACDLGKNRLRDRKRTGYLVRAAALTELLLRGRLTDDGGVVRAAPGPAVPDLVLDDLLTRVLEGRARKWRSWVRADSGATLSEVERQLDAAGVISLWETEILGLFPSRRPAVLATDEVKRLHALVDDVLRGDRAVAQIPAADAALTSLVAAVELKGVVSGRDRRHYRARLDELEERGGAAVPALRRVFRALRAARASGASAGAMSASGG